MRQRIVDVVYGKDPELGEFGFRLAAAPRLSHTFCYGDPRVLAHDLFEHVNGPKRIGEPEDELEALGAIWYLRGETNQITREPRRHLPVEDLAADLDSIAREHQYIRKSNRTRSLHADDNFMYAISLVDNSDGERARLLEADAVGYMRTGYRKAKRKYPNRYRALATFWSIVDVLTRFEKYDLANVHGYDYDVPLTLSYGPMGVIPRLSGDFYDPT